MLTCDAYLACISVGRYALSAELLENGRNVHDPDDDLRCISTERPPLAEVSPLLTGFVAAIAVLQVLIHDDLRRQWLKEARQCKTH